MTLSKQTKLPLVKANCGNLRKKSPIRQIILIWVKGHMVPLTTWWWAISGAEILRRRVTTLHLLKTAIQVCDFYTETCCFQLHIDMVWPKKIVGQTKLDTINYIIRLKLQVVTSSTTICSLLLEKAAPMINTTENFRARRARQAGMACSLPQIWRRVVVQSSTKQRSQLQHTSTT